MSEEAIKKFEAEVDEIIDKESDEVLKLFWMHVKGAILAFQNTNISHEDAYLRYEKLIKMGYIILEAGINNNKNVNTEGKDITEILYEVSRLLLKRTRKITIQYLPL